MSSILLLALFLCHFLADYTHLSTNKMLAAKRLGTPLWPIFRHAFVHALLMGIVIEAYMYYTIAGYTCFTLNFTIADKCFLVQLFSHFIIDVWKGKMNKWFRSLSNPLNKGHWYIFGIDQLFHASVIIYMVSIITS